MKRYTVVLLLLSLVFFPICSADWESPRLALIFDWSAAQRTNLGVATSAVDSMLRNPEKVNEIPLGLSVDSNGVSAGFASSDTYSLYIFWQIIYNVGLNIYVSIDKLEQSGLAPLDWEMVISDVSPSISNAGRVSVNTQDGTSSKVKIGEYVPSSALGSADSVKIESIEVLSDLSNVSGKYTATLTINVETGE